MQYVNKNVAFLKVNADPIILDDMRSFKLQSLVSQSQFQATVGDEQNVDDIIVLNTELMQMKRMCQTLQMGFEREDGASDKQIEISKQKLIDRDLEKALSCVYDSTEDFLAA